MLTLFLRGSQWTIRRLGMAVFVLLALVIVAPAAAHAATYTVGATADTTPTACPSATATDCSLRQLVMYVEAHPSPPDTIDVPAGDDVLDSAYGQIAITANVTIAGAGANVTTVEEPVPSNRSSSGDRVFDIEAPSGGVAPTVTLSGLEIAGGDANSANGYFGGDIVNSGTLSLDDDWVTNGFACSGGGVSNTGGTLSIERSLISANESACTSGGDDSGGVQNYGEPGSPDLPAHLTIDDSTIAANAARLGAGIYSWNDASNTVSITNSTVADNTEQAEGGNAARGGGGGVGISTGGAQLQNTILAGNTTTAGGGAGPVASNCSSASPVTSLGHNLEDANTCAFTGPGDLPNTNPQLGALANNGGPTATLALSAGSPAVAQVPAAGCSPTDQRGVARPTAANCDIGAFELTPASTPAATTTSTSGTTPTPAPSPSPPSPAPTPAPQTSFTVGSSTPGGVTLNASNSGAADVSAYRWTVGATTNANHPIVCPVSESELDLSSSAPVSAPVTLSTIDTSDHLIATATNAVSISSRLDVKRPATAGATSALEGLCHAPETPIPVPPLTPKPPAAPPRGSIGGAPPGGCTDDLDFGAIDVHGCLAEVADPKDLPGGITAELGQAICSSTGLSLCLPSLVVGGGPPGLSANRSPQISRATSQSDVVDDLTEAGIPSYYSYSAVRLNGLDIDPQNGTPLLIIPSMDAIAGSSVELFLNGLQLSPTAMPLSAYLPANGGLLANLTLARSIPIIGSLLPMTGALSVDLYPAGATLPDGNGCQYACAALNVDMQLPSVFGDGGGHTLTAAGVLKADAVNGVDLSSLDVNVQSAQFAGIGVSNVDFTYARLNHFIAAQATLELFGAGDITASIEFANGAFHGAGLNWTAGASGGIDLGGPIPVFLTQLGGKIQLNPTIINASATLSTGPSYFGCSLVSIKGAGQVRFAPFHFSVYAAGSLLCVPVANEYLEYGNGNLDFGGEVHWDMPWLPFSASADANVDVDLANDHFQFDGDANACILGFVCVDGEIVLSDVGFGVCAEIFGIHVGGGIIWPDRLKLFANTCDIDRFRSIHHFVRGTFRRAADGQEIAPPQSFILPRGKKVELVGFVGAGGAPKVTLVGPGGRTIDTPASGYVKTANDMVVADQKRTHTTYILIRNPAGGTWTVQPDLGSVPITAIDGAASLPDPNVHAQLHPASGARERLSYSLHPLAGQAVTFQEQAGNGKGGFDVVGHAHGARGTITFAPTLQMGRARRIVAFVTQYGHAREQVVLGHFTAALPGALPAPRGLRGHRSDTAVSLSWKPVPGASSYLVTVTIGKGKRAVHHALATRPTATLAGLPSGSALTVSVAARRSSPWADAPGRPAVTQLAALRPVIRRVTLVQST